MVKPGKTAKTTNRSAIIGKAGSSRKTTAPLSGGKGSASALSLSPRPQAAEEDRPLGAEDPYSDW
jgi:hypothetical protein